MAEAAIVGRARNWNLAGMSMGSSVKFWMTAEPCATSQICGAGPMSDRNSGCMETVSRSAREGGSLTKAWEDGRTENGRLMWMGAGAHSWDLCPA